MVSNAIKALRATRLKTTLIYLSLTFSIIAIFLITAISNGIISMYASMLKSDGDIIVTQAKISDTFFSNVDKKLIPQIEKLQGVKKVSALIVGAAPVEKLPIVAIYGSSANRFLNYKLIEGNYPKTSQVIVGKTIYEQLKNKKFILIGDEKFSVSGVYESDLGFENGGVVITLDEAGKIFNKSASMFLINIDIKSDIDKVVAEINNLSEKIEAKSTTGFIDNYNQFKIINKSSYAISLIAFVLGLLGIASIMSITVNERKDEFGIMKALGISSSRIILGLMIESSIIGFLAFFSAYFLSNIILFGIKHMDSLQGYINGEISTGLAFGVFIASILMATLGSFIPAYQASKIDPVTLIQRGS